MADDLLLSGKPAMSREAGTASAGIPAPHTIRDLGIRRSMVEDLALKILYLRGELLLVDLAEEMRLSLAVVSEVFDHLRKEQFCEIKGMVGGFQRINPTTQGKERAVELLHLSHYAGPAPVSLGDYIRQVRAQSIRGTGLHKADLDRAFNHLVVRPVVLSQLGNAIVGGRSIFLHGPSGTGKTAIADTIASLYRDTVCIPFSVEVGNQIISVFDSFLHEPADEPTDSQMDRRWVRCRRPRVVAGGELKLEMLDLQFNPVGRYYSAPLQMKANNGVLIVDDFGRQQARREDLLNRWMVPLDRGADYLTLAGGGRFSIPLDLLLVFATNLGPLEFANEPFLRRIQSKVKLDYSTPEEFHEIFRRVCAKSGLRYDSAVVDELVASLKKVGQPLRACDPGEIVQQICWVALYEDRPPCLDLVSVEKARRNYFLSA